MIRTIPSLLMLSLFLAGCSGPGGGLTSAEEAEFLERSEEIAGALQGALEPRLKQAMLAGGPVAAIEVCQQVAPSLTGATSDRFVGATVSRTALRLRNPDNAPDARSRAILERWANRRRSGKLLPEAAIEAGDATVIVHRPILTGPVCLNCHGDPGQMSAELENTLARLYPQDAATGFREGDLRGAFRIEFTRSP